MTLTTAYLIGYAILCIGKLLMMIMSDVHKHRKTKTWIDNIRFYGIMIFLILLVNLVYPISIFLHLCLTISNYGNNKESAE
jgi:hypothetical protein